MDLKEYLNSVQDSPVLRMDIAGDINSAREYYLKSKDKFEILFGNINDSADVAVPKGWRGIVNEYFAQLEALGSVRLKQVKQKFGEIRVYLDVLDPLDKPKVENLSKNLSFLCERICEFCGSIQDVVLFERGYVSRMCSSCLTTFCTYILVDWVLNEKNTQLNDFQEYCLRWLRGEHPEGYFTWQLNFLKDLQEKQNDNIPS